MEGAFQNIELMTPGISDDLIAIVVASTKKQKELFEELFQNEKHLIVVQEKWAKGGAGNGLGTLNAFLEASKTLDLFPLLEKGKPVAIYHAAGQGLRLFPLPLVWGRKAKVALPSALGRDSKESILEATIRQTKLFAPANKGRILVFWADQLFIPSTPPPTPEGDISLFCQMCPPPNPDSWEQEGWNHYGVVGIGSDGKCRQFEKISKEQYIGFSEYFKGGFGKSLGCFSCSKKFFRALLDEYRDALNAKTERLDTDPHFWMPLTLEKPLYQMLSSNEEQYDRLQRLKGRFSLVPYDVGRECFFFDLGSLEMFCSNLLELTRKNSRGAVLRAFLGLKEQAGNVILQSAIDGGKIEESIVIGSTLTGVSLKKSIVIDSQIKQGAADACLLYNVSTDALDIEKGTCRADILFKDRKLILEDFIADNPKNSWDVPFDGIPLSWHTLYDMIIGSSETP
jgi:hypothetical protein